MPSPFLSVIIPTRDRADLLRKALHSLLPQTMARERFEVLVVDNGSSDHTREIVSGMGKQLANLHYLFTATPGLHAARHCGMKKAQGDVLAFVDDDVEAQPTWLEGIADGFSRSAVAMVGGKCLPKFACAPPRWLRQRWSQPVGPGYFWGIFSILDFGEAIMEIPPTFIIGCNFAIRKPALLAAGGFHPDSMPAERLLYRGDGETWVGRAVAAQGGKALYHPKATVVHFVPASRMTYDYVYRRAFAEGITRSFVDLRKTYGRDHALPDDQPPARSRQRRFLSGLRRMAMALPLRYTVQKLEKKGLRDGFRCHQERFSRDAELRAWVLRPDWLENPAEADPA